MVKKILVLALLVLFAIPQFAGAQEAKPVQLALLNPVQLVPEAESISGVRLNLLYTVNADVTGLDLGLGINRTTGTYKGVQFGLANWNEMDSTGLQVGLVNRIAGRAIGVQYGMVNVVEGDLSGVQWGFVNWAQGYMHGAQYGAVNISKAESVGIDIGLVNYNEGSFTGFMLGFVNYTKSLHGLQIGLVNINGNKDPMEYMVIANWSF